MGPSLAQGRVDPMRVLVMAPLGQDSALSVGWWCLAATGRPHVSLPRAGARWPIYPDASGCSALLSTALLYGNMLPQQLGPHRMSWLRASIMLVIGGWGRPILLPAALQLSDRYT